MLSDLPQAKIAHDVPLRPKLVNWEIYICPTCFFKYDELRGERFIGIAPHTSVEKLYGWFRCPYCFTAIEEFMPSHTIGWA